MADETQTPDSEMIDFGFDASEADLARPILKNGQYDCKIVSTKNITSTNGHPMLQVTYKLTADAQDVNGKEVKAGFTVNDRILTQPTGGMTQEMIQKRIGAIHFSAVGAGKVNTGDWIGKTVRVSIAVREPRHDEKTGKDYPASNEVKGVYPVK